MVLQGVCKQITHIPSVSWLTSFLYIAPMFWGTLADRVGRRPTFLACLLVLCLACVGLALVPTSAYWLLMLLRCIQAAGSASTIALGMCVSTSTLYIDLTRALGAGLIGDIATPAERGGFFGISAMIPQVCDGIILSVQYTLIPHPVGTDCRTYYWRRTC